MDRTGLDIYIASTIKEESNIVKQFLSLDCKIVHFPNRRTDPVQYFFALFNFIRKHHIEVIHANGNSATLAVEMLAAKLGGCKKRIAHSHNTRCDQIRADKLLRPLFYATYTDGLACGRDAGIWLFQNRKFTVIKNGRDVARFQFNKDKRESMRRLLGINDGVAFGHVGGFVDQKNHAFILDIFKSILALSPNAKLFLMGDGVNRKIIEEKANKMGLKDNIIFTGNVDNVEDYLDAMDVMLLPSLFEGLPLSVIEWQASGLPCLISDRVTRDCALTSLVNFMSLNCSPDEWAGRLLELVPDQDRMMASATAIREIKKAGYDIKDSAEALKNIYMNK